MISEVPFSEPWITEEDKRAVLEALESRWLTGGNRAVEFENTFADYIGTDCAVSVNSCTAALHLAMRILDIGPGDEVIVPVLTFAATANAPIFCGARPVLVDVDEKKFTISVEDLTKHITQKTKAVIVVHYAGQSADMEEILEVAEDNNLHVVEDCAHSLGSSYRGKMTGSLGEIGCFSFYATKNITTAEGGMLVTNSRVLADRARLLREHAMTKSAIEREKTGSWRYDVVDVGYNYRLNEIQAALGISQLKRMNEANQRRIEAAHYYSDRLKDEKGIRIPLEAGGRSHVFHLYVIRVIEEESGVSRDELFDYLIRSGVGLSVHYTPLHLLTYYRRMFERCAPHFEVAERLYKQIMSLPMFPTITRTQQDYVVDKILSGRSSCRNPAVG